MKKLFLAVSALVFLLTSCGHRTIYEEHIDIERITWNRFDVKTFNVDIKDAEGKLTRATDRKNNRTPFIDSLRTAFETYADGKEEKQRKRR